MRWGLVGTGPWARTVHAPSLTSHPEAELAAVLGRDPGRTAAFAEGFGTEAVTDFDELLDRVDVVSFAVSPDVQVPLALRAVARGRRVLLEKPLGTDPAAVRAFDRELPAGARAVVFLTRLFEPVREPWLRQAIGRGFTGAHAEWVSSALSAGSIYADSAWRRGSGVVWDLMPHVLSQLVPVLGPVSGSTAEPWADYEDGLLVRLDHAGGAVSRVRLTLTARQDERAEWIRFDGPDGGTRSPDGPLDFVAAHRRAVTAVQSDADLAGDPLLSAVTPAAAIGPTEVMSALVAAVEAAT